jgi:ankyrin repeat protein
MRRPANILTHRRTRIDLAHRTRSSAAADGDQTQPQPEPNLHNKNLLLHQDLLSAKAAIAQNAITLQSKSDEAAVLTARLASAEKEIEDLKAQLEQRTAAKDKDVPPPAYQPESQPRSTTTPRTLNPALNTLNCHGEFPLYSQAAGGNYDEVKRLLEAGADATMRTAYRWTALHWAAGNGHAEVVELLLEYGADVNAVSDTGRTPLQMASDERIREILIDGGRRKRV